MFYHKNLAFCYGVPSHTKQQFEPYICEIQKNNKARILKNKTSIDNVIVTGQKDSFEQLNLLTDEQGISAALGWSRS
ncbi:hypothetical protein AZI11_00780 [Levilactobacillus brevis]|nr:hypothetical protein AZI11_00780 [Levilactobacillus brevis]ARN94277.1 hypothetical protein AZI12_00785 [Levilactobacillus brevis]